MAAEQPPPFIVEEGIATSNPAGAPILHPVTDGEHERVPEEFQRFENLPRKLSQVPKSDVDAKRRKA